MNSESEVIAHFRGAADFWMEGVGSQAARCRGQRDSTGAYDMHFLLVAANRLVTVAMEATKLLNEMGQHAAGLAVKDAVSILDAAQPERRSLRNHQEHLGDPAGVGSLMHFGDKVVRLLPFGSTETVIDAGQLEGDCRALYSVLCEVLGDPAPISSDWRIAAPNPDRMGQPARSAATAVACEQPVVGPGQSPYRSALPGESL